MRILILIFSYIFFLSPILNAVPSINLDRNYNNIYFNEHSVILIEKGDDLRYKEIDFYDEHWKIISLPSKWNIDAFPGWNGFVWYRIHIQFPDIYPDHAIGISLGEISDLDETYFNGVLIGKSGDYNNDKSHAYDIDRLYEIPTHLIKLNADNVISIRVKNYFPDESGPVNGLFIIGRYDQLKQDFFIKDFINIIFVVLYFFTGILFLMFFIKLPERKENLIFTILCFLFAVYFFLRSDLKYLIFNDFLILKKIEYMILFIIFAVFIKFIYSYFKKKENIINYLFYISSILMTLVVLFTREPSIWNAINIYYVEYTWLVGFGLILYLIIKEIKHNRDAQFIFFTIVILMITTILDLLYMRNIIHHELFSKIGLLSRYALFIFILDIALILLNSFVKLYKVVEEKTSELQYTLRQRDTAYKKIDSAYIEAIDRLGLIAEYRDPETGAHIKRVRLYVKLIAEKLHLDTEYINTLFYAAPMHDVGKVGIPDKILFKEGPLNDEEWEIMKTHTLIGASVFEGAESNTLKEARKIAISHHEKWDGTGYPFQVKGIEIYLSGRIMAVADIYDALRSKRPYKNEIDHDKVLEIMANGDEKIKPEHFDPEILNIFFKYADLFNEIFEVNKD